MRDSLILSLLGAVSMLGYLMRSQNAALTDQQRQIKDLTARLESKSKSVGLELQAQCAKQSALVYKDSGWEKDLFAGYKNHYNEKLNKCFVVMQKSDSNAASGKLTRTTFLADAFEGKTLANYYWMSQKNKEYADTAPFSCDIILPSGEKKFCKSSDEFDELIKVYMQ